MKTIEQLIESPLVKKALDINSWDINVNDRSDLIQECYMAIVRSYPNIQDHSKAEEFCVGIIINKRKDWMRKKYRRSQREEIGEAMELIEGSVDHNQELAELREVYRGVRDKFTDVQVSILDSIILDFKYQLADFGESAKIARDFEVSKTYVGNTLKKFRQVIGVL